MNQESNDALLIESLKELTKETQRLSVLIATIEERVANMVEKDLYIMENIKENKEQIDLLKQYKAKMIGFVTAIGLLSGGTGAVTANKILAILSKDDNTQAIEIKKEGE